MCYKEPEFMNIGDSDEMFLENIVLEDFEDPEDIFSEDEEELREYFDALYENMFLTSLLEIIGNDDEEELREYFDALPENMFLTSLLEIIGNDEEEIIQQENNDE